MPIASEGSGPGAAARALASQVKPTFMGPALASSVYGALFAGSVAPIPAALHLLATFLALYVAHVEDGYVDAYVRGEDESLPLTPAGCRLALVGAGAGFAGCVVGLGWLVGPAAALLVLPLGVLGFLHAPVFDRHPVGTSADYAVGVGLVVVGGYYVQAGSLSATAVGVAGVFVPMVAAGAVLEDVVDLPVDRRLGKRTVASVHGADAARTVALGLVGGAMLLVGALAVVGVLPRAGLWAVPALAVGALGTRAADPHRGVFVLMGALAVAASVLLLSTTAIPAL